MFRTVLRTSLATLALLVGGSVSGQGYRAEARSMEPAEIDLIPRLLPSVVNISFTRVETPHDASGKETGPARRVKGVGSGFIISPDGEIITNNHVIDGATEIRAILQDGTSLRARLVGTSAVSDIALIRVNPEQPLPTVTLGDSSALRVGQRVIAIGNPLGLGGTVTSGIVSALNRDIASTPFDDFIQTDAAINHGNSGGPLFDGNGQVIGVNTSIYSPTEEGGSIGLGFSIPINDAKFIIERLRKFGRVRPGYIGVSYQQVTPDVAQALRMPGTIGAIVSSVEPNSPAAKAGVQVADIVIGFNGERPRDTRALTRAVLMTPFGNDVPLELWREGRTFSVPVGVVEAPYSRTAGTDMNMAQRAPMTKSFDIGLRLAPVTDEFRGKFHLASGLKGVVVANVVPGTVAADNGLVPGDVITYVQRQPVATPDEAMARIDKLRAEGGRRILILVEGQDGRRWMTLPIADEDFAPGPVEASAQPATQDRPKTETASSNASSTGPSKAAVSATGAAK